MIVFAEELEQWLWEEGMWPWLSGSNGGNSAGECGFVPPREEDIFR